MSVSVGKAFHRGLRRLVSPDAVPLLLVLYATTVPQRAVDNPVAALLEQAATRPAPWEGLLYAAGWVAALYATIVAYRVLVPPSNEASLRRALTRDVVERLAHLLGAVALLVAVFGGPVVVADVVFPDETHLSGLLTLVVVLAALYAVVALSFWTPHIAVTGDGFRDGLRTAWRLTKGSRGPLAVLLVAAGALAWAVGVVVEGFAPATGPGTVLVGSLGQAIGTLLTVAVTAAAYRQVTELPETRATGQDTS